MNSSILMHKIEQNIMKLDQLNYFLETAKQEHVGKASKILAISPSAISHSIANLEVELGRKLFKQSGKNIYLTVHGKYLAEKVEIILRDINILKDEISSDDVDHQGNYRVAAAHMLCEQMVTPLIAQYLERNQKVSAEIYSLRSTDVVKQVIEGNMDLGICHCPQNDIRFDSIKVHQGNLVIMVRKKHPLLELISAERIKQLGHYRAALAKSFQGIENCESHPIFDNLNVKVSPHLLYDSISVGIAAIQHSNMFTLLPEYYAILYNDVLTPLIKLNWTTPYFISIIWPRNRVLTKFLQNFIEDLRVNFRSVSQNQGQRETRFL